MQRAGRRFLPRHWRIHQNDLLDLCSLKFSPLRDGALRFAKAGQLPR